MRSISAGKDRRVALLREFEGSGLTMAEFCRRREVGYSTMASWRRSLRGRTNLFVEVEPQESVPASAASGAGADADLICRSTGHLCAELVLPAGAVLRVYQITPTGGRA
jgi:hypothetical protein